MECDNRFYLYTGHRFYGQYHLLLLLSRNPPLSNFRIVSEQGRTKDLKTQNWQLYKSPERASAVSTNIWGDQPSRRSGSGFIVFGSEAWVPVTSLGACDQSVCLEEYQLPVELDTKDLPQFLLLLLSSALGESWVVWVDSAWHCMFPHLQQNRSYHLQAYCKEALRKRVNPTRWLEKTWEGTYLISCNTCKPSTPFFHLRSTPP